MKGRRRHRSQTKAGRGGRRRRRHRIEIGHARNLSRPRLIGLSHGRVGCVADGRRRSSARRRRAVHAADVPHAVTLVTFLQSTVILACHPLPPLGPSPSAVLLTLAVHTEERCCTLANVVFNCLRPTDGTLDSMSRLLDLPVSDRNGHLPTDRRWWWRSGDAAAATVRTGPCVEEAWRRRRWRWPSVRRKQLETLIRIRRSSARGDAVERSHRGRSMAYVRLRRGGRGRGRHGKGRGGGPDVQRRRRMMIRLMTDHCRK